MMELDRIDQHAEVHIEIANATDARSARATAGGEIFGLVSVLLRKECSFAIHLYWSCVEESIFGPVSQKQVNTQA